MSEANEENLPETTAPSNTEEESESKTQEEAPKQSGDAKNTESPLVETDANKETPTDQDNNQSSAEEQRLDAVSEPETHVEFGEEIKQTETQPLGETRTSTVEKLPPQFISEEYFLTSEEQPEAVLDESSESTDSKGSEGKEAVSSVADDFGPKKTKAKKKSFQKTEKPKPKLLFQTEVLGEGEGEEDEEYVWVEEEVDEEIEVETDDDEDVEGGSEEIEEELEEDEGGEGEKTEEEEIAEEIAIEGEEEKEFYAEIKEEIDAEVGEELEEAEEIEIEAKEAEEGEQEFESEIEQVEGEFVEEEEEFVEEEGTEEMLEEESIEEEVKKRKKKRKFKTIKVYKMVRKLKKDVLEMLKEKAEPSIDDERQVILEQERKEEQERELVEASKKERERLFELLKFSATELINLKRKNKALTKSIIEHFSRQKRLDLLQETVPTTPELVQKYYKKLNVMKEFSVAAAAEKTRLSGEVNVVKVDLDSIVEDYEKEKLELLKWENELGKAVIQAQTGKPLEEHVVNHLVQRHDIVLQKLSEERLKLVVVQHELADKEAALKNLISIDENLSLIDYEQLKLDRHIFTEKLEERESELAHVRQKVLSIIQTQAHVLEKSDAIIDDIENCNALNTKKNTEVNELREKVNKLRKTRDHLRVETTKMKRNAGLLNRPKLAIDFEDAIGKIGNSKSKLDKLVKTFHKQKVMIENLRKTIVDINLFKEVCRTG